jgi:ribosomal protein S12 methylthiotransferase accessory factor
VEPPYHKDKEPRETIDKIRSILSGLGIFPAEQWRVFSDTCFSVYLADTEIPVLAANGKGGSKLSALAGAYAELMERLQSRRLVLPSYGLMRQDPVSYPDSKVMTIDQVLNRRDFEVLYEAFDDELVREVRAKKKTFACLPYYSVRDDDVVYLPGELVALHCRSNGLCAGNTPEEALCQGICEIMERFVARQIFYRKMSVPTVPLTEVMGLPAGRTVKDFTDRGYHVVVKDCTLEGSFPVLAVIVSSEDRTRYRVKFGSDPLFEVALLRCLHEVAQGMDEERFESSLLPVDWTRGPQRPWNDHETDAEYYHFLRKGLGQFPTSFLAASGTRSFGQVFVKRFTGHRDLLGHLLGLLRLKGCDIFVRDVSFLGFPSYHVYVPNMTEVYSLKTEDVRFELFESDTMKRVLLRMGQASQDELRTLARQLEYKLTHPHMDWDRFFLRIGEICLDESSDLLSLSPRALITLLHLCTGDWQKAYAHLALSNPEVDSIARTDTARSRLYAACLLAFLKLRSEDRSDEKAKAALADLYGEVVTDEIIHFTGRTDKILGCYRLPDCGDCASCPAAPECAYEEWRKMEAGMETRMRENPIDQKQLARIFRPR